VAGLGLRGIGADGPSLRAMGSMGDFNPHLYADDTQIQGSCRFGSANQLQSTLSACLDKVSD